MSTNVISSQIAKHLREVYFGGNWTCSDLKTCLSGLTLNQITQKVYSLNSIGILVYHIHYYVIAALDVLAGKPLTAKDKYSFDIPDFQSQAEWNDYLVSVWEDAENLAQKIEKIADDELNTIFVEEKYGNLFRNFIGNIEHIHYHLGQIALIKKIILSEAK